VAEARGSEVAGASGSAVTEARGLAGATSGGAGALRRVLLGLGFAAALFLAFPFELGGRVVDLGWLFAFAPPALLLLAVRGLPPGRAAALGFAAGTLAYGAVWHWIFVVTVRYGHAPAWVGVAAPLVLAFYPAAFIAAFAAAAARLSRTAPPGPVALAALWTALEHGRTFLLTGFPWAALGYAQHENAALLGLAPFAGVHALTFASALGGLALLEAALRREPGRSAGRAVRALALLLALHAAGAALRPAAVPGAQTLRVAVLQGNIDQGVKWSVSWAERTLAIYEALTREAAAAGARLVVWPETAVPGAPDGDRLLEARLAELARETGAALLVGAVGLEFTDEGQLAGIFDSALLYDASGQRLARYDKSHLVPFGEYLPLRALLGRFIRAVATGAAGRDVSAGAEPRALPPFEPVAGAAAVTLGVPICYELLFSDLVRRFAGGGAQVLLAITNDAWYGRTGAPHQFLAITALRSAENAVWTARAANTGVSALIDARGQVQQRTPIFERGLLVGDVPLRDEAHGPTFYTRTGDWLPLACWLASGALFVRARRRTRGAAA
jgi:apolipoprotein N-acyltransferase